MSHILRSAPRRQAPRTSGASKHNVNPHGLKGGPVQAGFWLPNRIWATRRYLRPLRREIAVKKKGGTLKPLEPVVLNFKNWVNTHSVYRMWMNSMITETNEWFHKRLFGHNSQEDDELCDGVEDSNHGGFDHSKFYVEDFDEFCELINETITTAPAFTKLGLVSTPLLGIFFAAMSSKPGIALFHDTTFNAEVKKLLDAWNTYLKTSASLYLLDINNPEQEGSWISKAAKDAGVWDDMLYDPNKQGYGFDSWNDFFLRQFEPNARPYHGNPENQICIGCETTPWMYQDNAQMESTFWIKDMPYSLVDLFGGQRQWAKLFEGGQVYQGFLSAMHYHRWRSPLRGELVRSWVQPGTYFAQRPWPENKVIKFEGLQVQPYLGHVSARAIFIFKTRSCGYVALICVGMVEVSSCVISPSKYIVEEGAPPVHIEYDDEIGRFEFGGSTHVMMFQKDMVQLETWAVNAESHRHDPAPMPLGSLIATAK